MLIWCSISMDMPSSIPPGYQALLCASNYRRDKPLTDISILALL